MLKFGRVGLSRSARTIHSLVGRPPLIQDLRERGLVAQLTSPKLSDVANNESLTVYLGVDPTASSLHTGNLLALMGLLHFHLRGHSTISLIGGATGFIGDPGGRSTERPLLSAEELGLNVSGITEQVHRFFKNAESYAADRISMLYCSSLASPKVLNNISWLGEMGLLPFLRLVGKHAKVNVMIGRDSVKSRLDSEQGISFTEFSYQLLQAYDFYVLHRDHGCRVQIGGSDQWGNIVAGLDLIRRQAPPRTASSPVAGTDEEAYGITLPLLLTSSGEKFGKSAGNAVWLDNNLTSFYDFYQFFLRVEDADVSSYLRKFTLLPIEQIENIVTGHMSQPELRTAQKVLASEVTELVHGNLATRQAKAATSILFHPTTAVVRASDIIAAFHSNPRMVLIPVSRSAEIIGESLTKLSARYNQTASRGEARKLLQSGGFYLNNQRVNSADRVLQFSDLIDERIAILRTGKDNHLILALDG
ncbi:hypothetical protein BS47DRAFT_1335868 [Hydnum rufescens UP504]|uniref:Tyrosine--tRNA ligase n=1 Tax=Hydnum rufescens UP504 TaxID=1448309 RepID=A0A9P6B9K6_9AGAM|nr:hypothetical protein BS47DRAFT_1335868 [Hydnum rufescens UP504]